MKKFILLMLGIAPFCVAQAQSTNDTGNMELKKDEQAIWNNMVELHSAVFGNKDSIVIGKLVSNMLQYGHSTGLLEDRLAMIHNAATSATKYEQVTNQLISIKTIGKVGILRMDLKASSIDKGVTTPVHLGIIQVWKREGDNWKLIERQGVKLPIK